MKQLYRYCYYTHDKHADSDIHYTLNVSDGDYKIGGNFSCVRGIFIFSKSINRRPGPCWYHYSLLQGLSNEHGLVIEYAMVVEFSLLKVEFEYGLREYKEVKKNSPIFS